MKTAAEALQKLREGNQRFVAGEPRGTVFKDLTAAETTKGQTPMAIILGCSDSRAPAEIIFDQGLGDLFVIRVAGNIVAPSQIGSVEFAAERFGTPLVVVLGHSLCGAVCATLECLEGEPAALTDGMSSIVESIRPAVQPLFDRADGKDRPQLLNDAIQANIRAAVNELQYGSPLLEKLSEQKRLLIVGAKYSLETGEVDFLTACPLRKVRPTSRPPWSRPIPRKRRRSSSDKRPPTTTAAAPPATINRR